MHLVTSKEIIQAIQGGITTLAKLAKNFNVAPRSMDKALQRARKIGAIEYINPVIGWKVKNAAIALKEACCADMRKALKDDRGPVIMNRTMGCCLRGYNPGEVFPFTYCPWCGKAQPRTLATSPAMLYRP